MAHHHNNHHTPSGGTTPRPLAVRILSLATLLLPPVLFIISLSLTLATLYNQSYAVSDLYTSNSTASGVQLYASPFYHCPATSDGAAAVDDPASFQQNCSRVDYLGGKGMDACYAAQGAGFPNTQFCQKSVKAAELYVAGAVLVGVAVLAGFVAAVLGWKAAWGSVAAAAVMEEKDGQTAAASAVVWAAPAVAWLAGFLGLVAALCLVAAQALGISTYVSDKRPTAGDDVDAYQGRWYMGTPALAFSSVAWLSAALGAFVSSTGFGVKGL